MPTHARHVPDRVQIQLSLSDLLLWISDTTPTGRELRRCVAH